ncbi:MAG: aminopeptidase P family N-terminal domain-containing protein, partial [Rhodothermales bacterium]
MSNINKIQAAIREEGATSAFVTSITDIRWACGFTGSNGLLVVTPDTAALITDGRYITQSKEETEDVEIYIASGPLVECVKNKKLLPD